MVFLIDYENVKNPGMMGTEFLQAGDHVIIFYSTAAPNMEERRLADIKASGCRFQICKLIKVRKNALDFYIAARLGELWGGGYRGNAVIISKDDGFHSLADYGGHWINPQRRVLVSESIERGIVSANEPDARTARVRQKLKSLDIGAFYSAYAEGLRLRKMLDEAFADTQFLDRTGEMETILRSGKTPKVIYLDTLRKFGRKDGLLIYKKLKDCADF